MKFQPWLRKKSHLLYLKIVREKASPEYIARGWAIGMFYGCLIPMGGQLLLSIPTAFLLKGSKIGATLGTLITNHVTVFFIYPLQCYVGNRVIGGSLSLPEFREALKTVLDEMSLKSLLALSADVVVAFFVGGALLTLVMTPLTYVVVLHMVRKYQQLRKKRKCHISELPDA